MKTETVSEAWEPDPLAIADPFGNPWGRPLAPYPGLRPFDPQEASIFRGRDSHISALMERLRSNRFVAVVGTSGCGKSSLVRAGLIPRLEVGIRNSRTFWRAAVMRPGQGAFLGLAAALLVLFREPKEKVEAEAPALAERLSRSPFGLSDFLRERPLPPDANLLLLVDQFEEIFRYRAEGEARRRETDVFVQTLIKLTQSREFPVYIVLTMRSDFLGHCALFPDLPTLLNGSQYLTPRLTENEMREAIIDPALEFEADVEPDLIEQMLRDVARINEEADQLPLLQHALMRVWEERCRRVGVAVESRDSEAPMTGEDYGNICPTPASDRSSNTTSGKTSGDRNPLQSALGDHLEAIFTQKSTPGQQVVAERLFRRLTRSYVGEKMRDPAAFWKVAATVHSIENFIEAGIATNANPTAEQKTAGENAKSATRDADAIRADLIAVVEVFRAQGRYFLQPYGEELKPQTRLDISHEVLYRQWPRLAKWMQKEAKAHYLYEQLYTGSVRWEKEKEAKAKDISYWTGPRLAEAEEMMATEGMSAVWARRYSIPDEARGMDDSKGRAYRPSDHKRILKFLEASHAAEEAKIKEAERSLYYKTRLSVYRMAAAVAAVLVAITFVALLFALERNAKANEQANLAKTEARRAQIQTGKAITANHQAAVNLEKAVESARQADSARVAAQKSAKEAKRGKQIAEERTKYAQKKEQFAEHAAEKEHKAEIKLKLKTRQLVNTNLNLQIKNKTILVQLRTIIGQRLDIERETLLAREALIAARMEQKNALIAAAREKTAEEAAIKAAIEAVAQQKRADEAVAEFKKTQPLLLAQNRRLYELFGEGAMGSALESATQPGLELTALNKVSGALGNLKTIADEIKKIKPDVELPIPQLAEAALTLAVAAAGRALPLSAKGIPWRTGAQDTPELRTRHDISAAELSNRALTAFSPNGERVVTLAGKQTLLLFDAKSGKRLAQAGLPPDRPDSLLRAVIFDPRGDRVVALGTKHVFVWRGVDGRVPAPKLDMLCAPSKDATNFVALTHELTKGIRLLPNYQNNWLVEDDDAPIALTVGADSSFIVASRRGVSFWNSNGSPRPLPQKVTLAAAQKHVGPLTDLTLAPDGSRFATAGQDGIVRLWNAQTGRPFGNGDEAVLFPTETAFSKKQMPPSIRDMSHARSGPPLWMIRFTPDGRWMLGLSDFGMFAWNLAERRNGTHASKRLSLPSDIRTFAVAADDAYASSRQTQTASRLSSFAATPHGVYRIALGTNDGKSIVAALTAEDMNVNPGPLLVRDARGALKMLGEDAVSAVSSVTFSPDGGRLLAFTSAGNAVLWERADIPALKSFLTGPPRDAAFGSDGTAIAVTEWNTTSVWDSDSGKLRIRTPLEASGDDSVALSARAAAYVRTSKGAASLFFMGDSKEHRLPGPADAAGGTPDQSSPDASLFAAFSPDGNQIALVRSSSLLIVDTDKVDNLPPSSRPVSVPGVPLQPVGAFSSNGNSFLMAAQNGDLFVRTSANDTMRRIPPPNGIKADNPKDNRVTALALNERGQIAVAYGGGVYTASLAAASPTGTLAWRLLAGRPDMGVTALAYSPDGDFLATGEEDGLVRVWNMRATDGTDALQPEHSYRVHVKSVRSVRFDPRGERLLSTSEDGTVKLYQRDITQFEASLSYLRTQLEASNQR